MMFPYPTAHKEKRFWDGEKSVFVVLAGSTVVLPCMNRRALWTEGSQEDQQQVVHWDWQPPGVRPDAAERLVDLYASGEKRKYGPHFMQEKMNITADAFSRGDFSLSISDLQPSEKGLYVCHLHHHYCGLHERRIFRLIVGPPLQQPVPTSHNEILEEVPVNNEPTKRLTVVELPRDTQDDRSKHCQKSKSVLLSVLKYVLDICRIEIALLSTLQYSNTNKTQMTYKNRKKKHSSKYSLCSYNIQIVFFSLYVTFSFVQRPACDIQIYNRMYHYLELLTVHM